MVISGNQKQISAVRQRGTAGLIFNSFACLIFNTYRTLSIDKKISTCLLIFMLLLYIGGKYSKEIYLELFMQIIYFASNKHFHSKLANNTDPL